MAKKGYTAEQIINKLREVEVLTAKGESMDSAIRKVGGTRNTCYRWRKEYGSAWRVWWSGGSPMTWLSGRCSSCL